MLSPQAIAIAKEAGIGVKAAKKRLSQLEQNEKIKQELEEALATGDTPKLKQAVASARHTGLEIEEAKEVLRKLVQRDACREQLKAAIEVRVGEREGVQHAHPPI